MSCRLSTIRGPQFTSSRDSGANRTAPTRSHMKNQASTATQVMTVTIVCVRKHSGRSFLALRIEAPWRRNFKPSVSSFWRRRSNRGLLMRRDPSGNGHSGGRSVRKDELHKLSGESPQCANPDCGVKFDFRTGRLFHVRHSDKWDSYSVEHFWLCESCSKQFDIRSQEGSSILIGQARDD